MKVQLYIVKAKDRNNEKTMEIDGQVLFAPAGDDVGKLLPAADYDIETTDLSYDCEEGNSVDWTNANDEGKYEELQYELAEKHRQK